MQLPRPITAIFVMALIAGALPIATLAQDPAELETSQPTMTDRIGTAIVRDAAEAAGGPLRAQAWLRDRIAFEPYEGVLKGDRGTYLTAAGNGADQALLLATLLASSGASGPTRFASCPVDEAVAARLAEHAAATTSDGPVLVDQASELAGAIDDDALRAAIEELMAEREAVRTDVEASRILLAEALETAGYPWDIEHDDATDVPATHTWAQAWVDDTWLDLDVTSVDGEPPCEATETVEALPPTSGHQVSFTVLAVERSGDRWVERALLNATMPTKDLATARVALLFGEPAGLLAEETGGGFGLGLDNGDESRRASYTPVLRIDNGMLVGEPVELPSPETAGLENVDDALGGALDLFESMPGTEALGDDAEDDGAAAGGDGLAAIWLDIALVRPDGHTTALRSEVLDRIGPATGGDMSASAVELEPLEVVDGDYAALTTMWQIGLLLGETAVPEGALDPALDPFTLDGLSGHLDALVRTLPAMRRDLGAGTGAPAVVLAGLGVHEAAAGDVVDRLVIDALHVPSPGSSDAAAAASDAQALLGAEQLLGAIAGGTTGPLDSAAAVLGAARSAGSPLTLLSPGDEAAVSGASDRAQARMAARLADGYRLLAPATAPTLDGTPRMAWWTIDPLTGLVRDEHESGRRSASTEYSIQTETQLSYMERMRRFACSVARPVVLAATLIYVGTGGAASPIHEVLESVTEAMQAEAERRAEREAARRAACSGTPGGSA